MTNLEDTVKRKRKVSLLRLIKFLKKRQVMKKLPIIDNLEVFRTQVTEELKPYKIADIEDEITKTMLNTSETKEQPLITESACERGFSWTSGNQTVNG